MERWIGVDTSSQALSLVLAETERLEKFEDANIVASEVYQSRLQHGQSLLDRVQRLMGGQSWKAEDITALVLGIGPGSYTGLRIAATFAKLWATSLNLPIYTVSSLALMLGSREGEGLVLPLMDARRLSAYLGLFNYQGGIYQRLQEDKHVDWQSWLDQESALFKDLDHLTLLADKPDSFVDVLKKTYPHCRLDIISGEEALPQIERAFAPSLWTLWKRVEDPHILTPNYAHATLAEQTWAKENQRSVAGAQENEAYIHRYKTSLD